MKKPSLITILLLGAGLMQSDLYSMEQPEEYLEEAVEIPTEEKMLTREEMQQSLITSTGRLIRLFDPEKAPWATTLVYNTFKSHDVDLDEINQQNSDDEMYLSGIGARAFALRQSGRPSNFKQQWFTRMEQENRNLLDKYPKSRNAIKNILGR